MYEEPQQNNQLSIINIIIPSGHPLRRLSLQTTLTAHFYNKPSHSTPKNAVSIIDFRQSSPKDFTYFIGRADKLFIGSIEMADFANLCLS
jgi:hypothetical protein